MKHWSIAVLAVSPVGSFSSGDSMVLFATALLSLGFVEPEPELRSWDLGYC